MASNDDTDDFFINRVLGAYLAKRFDDVNQAVEWASENGINASTMRDVFYKNGSCGRKVLNQIITALFNIDEEKTASLIDDIMNLSPISESQKVWNSINASEKVKLRLALVAKATLEIEESLNKSK